MAETLSISLTKTQLPDGNWLLYYDGTDIDLDCGTYYLTIDINGVDWYSEMFTIKNIYDTNIQIPDFYDHFSNQSELTNYTPAELAYLSIINNQLHITAAYGETITGFIRTYNDEFIIIGNYYKISFDIIDFTPNTIQDPSGIVINVFDNSKMEYPLSSYTFPYHFEYILKANGIDPLQKFIMSIITYNTSIPLHVIIDNLRLESLTYIPTLSPTHPDIIKDLFHLPLRFYNSKYKQNYYKCKDLCDIGLLNPIDHIIPFVIDITGLGSIISIQTKIICHDGSIESDLSDSLTYTTDMTNYIVYQNGQTLSGQLFCGIYYLKVTINGSYVFYSEHFEVKNITNVIITNLYLYTENDTPSGFDQLTDEDGNPIILTI